MSILFLATIGINFGLYLAAIPLRHIVYPAREAAAFAAPPQIMQSICELRVAAAAI